MSGTTGPKSYQPSGFSQPIQQGTPPTLSKIQSLKRLMPKIKPETLTNTETISKPILQKTGETFDVKHEFKPNTFEAKQNPPTEIDPPKVDTVAQPILNSSKTEEKQESKSVLSELPTKLKAFEEKLQNTGGILSSKSLYEEHDAILKEHLTQTKTTNPRLVKLLNQNTSQTFLEKNSDLVENTNKEKVGKTDTEKLAISKKQVEDQKALIKETNEHIRKLDTEIESEVKNQKFDPRTPEGAVWMGQLKMDKEENQAILEKFAKDAAPALAVLLRDPKNPEIPKETLGSVGTEEWKELYNKHDCEKLWLFMGSPLGGQKPEMFEYMTTLQDIEQNIKNFPEQGAEMYHNLQGRILGQAKGDGSELAMNVSNKTAETMQKKIDDFTKVYEKKLNDIKNSDDLKKGIKDLEVARDDDLHRLEDKYKRYEANITRELMDIPSYKKEVELKTEMKSAGSTRQATLKNSLDKLQQERTSNDKNNIANLEKKKEENSLEKQEMLQKCKNQFKSDKRELLDKLFDPLRKEVHAFNQELLVMPITVEDAPFDGVHVDLMPNLHKAIKGEKIF